MATTAYDHLHSISLSDVDAEARRLLGDEEYEKLLNQGKISVERIIEHLIYRDNFKRLSTHFRPQSLFTEDLIDGKTAACGPDK